MPPPSEPSSSSRLERIGLGFLRRRESRLDPVEADDDIHYLNERERKDLRAIQSWAMVRAAVAGTLSALGVAVVEQLILPALGLSDEGPTGTQVMFYGALIAVAGVAAALEIGYLYYDALRAVHDLARSAGLRLFEGPEERQDAVAAALARAALELPDPREPVFGVDPGREVSGWRLVLVTLLYKAKIALTSFLLKALLRRAMGRAMVRSWLPFVAVPVTAIWNVLITWKVLREARLRVMGPSAAATLLDEILGAHARSDPEAHARSDLEKEAVLRSIAVTIVRKHRMHPNHHILLAEAHRRLGHPDLEALDDPERYFDLLKRLSPPEQRIALQVLAVAIILDGRISKRDRALLDVSCRAAGRRSLLAPTEALRRAFVRGDDMSKKNS